jgi:hypothetical protein
VTHDVCIARKGGPSKDVLCWLGFFVQDNITISLTRRPDGRCSMSVHSYPNSSASVRGEVDPLIMMKRNTSARRRHRGTERCTKYDGMGSTRAMQGYELADIGHHPGPVALGKLP